MSTFDSSSVTTPCTTTEKSRMPIATESDSDNTAVVADDNQMFLPKLTTPVCMMRTRVTIEESRIWNAFVREHSAPRNRRARGDRFRAPRRVSEARSRYPYHAWQAPPPSLRVH